MVDAIILAGSGEDTLIKDIENKALLEIKGKYMVQYVIDSLKSAKSVGKVVLIGPDVLKSIFGSDVDAVLNSEKSIIDNVAKGVEFLGENRNIIICTSDIPMISADAIEDFIRQCEEINVDIGYPIIEKSLNDSKYPDAKRTYVKLKDGTFTGGNILYINPNAVKKCYSTARYLVDNRKNLLNMAKIFGIVVFAKLLIGTLGIKTVEKRANKILGVNAKAIMTVYPEVGNDVDKIEDVDFVSKYINKSA